ncbi:unnamed protein product, partial [Iphiclides podalirius]
MDKHSITAPIQEHAIWVGRYWAGSVDTNRVPGPAFAGAISCILVTRSDPGKPGLSDSSPVIAAPIKTPRLYSPLAARTCRLAVRSGLNGRRIPSSSRPLHSLSGSRKRSVPYSSADRRLAPSAGFEPTAAFNW